MAGGTPYYERFLKRFPTVCDLAAAPLDDVLAVWEGLGFYGRARNLHAAARAIVEDHRGLIPPSYDALASLPGIGPYTAGAVASIAFEVPVPAVAGHVTPGDRARLPNSRGCDDRNRSEANRGDCRSTRSRGPARRVQSSDDGARCDDLHATRAGMSQMSPREALLGARGRGGTGPARFISAPVPARRPGRLRARDRR